MVENIIKINWYNKKEEYLSIQKMLYIRNFANISTTLY